MTVMDEYGRLGELLVYWCEFYTSAANACCLDVPRARGAGTGCRKFWL